LAPGELRKTPQSNLPKRIGRYEVFLEIGAGGMARVYLAGLRGQRDTKEIVVVKVLRREVIEDEHVVNLFLDEARIATRLRHPNVILTREVVAQPPDYLLAMEFQDGQSLLQVLGRLGRNAVPLDEHVWILTQVLAGLEHAHGLTDAGGRPLGIVHRDVSPSNVLVCYSGQIKLLDFGIAKATGALAATQDGVVKGKVGYAAPEQCLGKPADRRSDIYAVGVMLWEAITGRRRASGETWHSVLQARIDDAEPRLEEVAPDAPASLCATAERALAHDADMRYRTAHEFKKDLEAYLAARNAQVTPARIAAMIRPHFVQDREEQRRAIDAYLRADSGQSHVSGKRRIPLPAAAEPAAFDAAEDEDTSRIPVDDALLLKSRRGSLSPPAAPSAPPLPSLPAAVPPSGSVVPRGVAVAQGVATEESAVIGAPISGKRPSGSPPEGVDAVGLPDPYGELAPKRGFKPWMAVAAAVGLGVVAGAISAVRSHSSSEPAVPTSMPAPEHTLQAATGAPAATHAPAAAASQVRVRIAVSPPDAELRLDGLLLKSNPFTSVFPKGDELHELSASADGYREERQGLQFLQDVDVQITLHRGRGVSRVGVARPAAPAAPGPARPATEAHSAAPAFEPGMDLKVKQDPKGKHAIDEKDPYAQ
jgi:serine/threonine protein kinase